MDSHIPESLNSDIQYLQYLQTRRQDAPDGKMSVAEFGKFILHFGAGHTRDEQAANILNKVLTHIDSPSVSTEAQSSAITKLQSIFPQRLEIKEAWGKVNNKLGTEAMNQKNPKLQDAFNHFLTSARLGNEEGLSNLQRLAEQTDNRKVASNALLELGILSEDRGDYDKAVAHFIHAAEGFGNDRGLVGLERVALKLEGGRTLEKQKAGDIYYQLGVIYEAKGDDGKAIDFYSHALRLGNPASEMNLISIDRRKVGDEGNQELGARVDIALGSFYESQGDFRRAAQSFSNALNAGNQEGLQKLEKLTAHLDLHRAAEASEAHLLLGYAYKEKLPAKAIQEFMKASEFGSKEGQQALLEATSRYPFAAANLYTTLATEYESKGRKKEAMQHYMRALDNYDSAILKGAQVEKEVEAIASRFSKSPETKLVAARGYAVLGNSCKQRHDLQKAGDHFSRAIELGDKESLQKLERLAADVDKQPNLEVAADVHEQLGGVYKNQGRFREAIDQYLRVFDLGGVAPAIHPLSFTHPKEMGDAHAERGRILQERARGRDVANFDRKLANSAFAEFNNALVYYAQAKEKPGVGDLSSQIADIQRRKKQL
jgi:tetratricopeptide (TPR) repeat protein